MVEWWAVPTLHEVCNLIICAKLLTPPGSPRLELEKHLIDDRVRFIPHAAMSERFQASRVPSGALPTKCDGSQDVGWAVPTKPQTKVVGTAHPTIWWAKPPSGHGFPATIKNPQPDGMRLAKVSFLPA